MRSVAELTEPINVSVRFFAAARAAAGADTAELTVPPGATVADVVKELCCRSDQLALVLQRCSYLCDGIAVRDQTTTVLSGQTLDVLPPFAGG
ncbi:molybdopterin synthase sulfur carrier subunit [Mycolicibacterium litorale]|nr:molybdopterin synthase sulfur carrier subunit [Mycolicibacterium litorale]